MITFNMLQAIKPYKIIFSINNIHSLRIIVTTIIPNQHWVKKTRKIDYSIFQMIDISKNSRLENIAMILLNIQPHCINRSKIFLIINNTPIKTTKNQLILIKKGSLAINIKKWMPTNTNKRVFRIKIITISSLNVN